MPGETARQRDPPPSSVAAFSVKCRQNLRQVRQNQQAAAPSIDPGGGGSEGEHKAVDRKRLLAPLTQESPVAFLLDAANRPDRQEPTLSLSSIERRSPKELLTSLAGKRLVIDARFAGLADGLLNDGAGSDAWAATIEDNWGRNDNDLDAISSNLKVEVLSEDERAAGAWQEVLKAPYRVSPEGEAVSWLIVQKRRGEGESEDSRAVARKAQRLDEHQRWAGEEAARIAGVLGLDEAAKAMLVAAARHHDDGKSAPRWQRAFNATREGGPYAKTTGYPNQHLLNGYRHELKSALDAERDGLDGIDPAEPRFELALHLIAAHHGNARPAIGVRGYDDLPPSAAEAGACAIALRFARLQRQWGPWGLAWWEALLRAADQAASRRLHEEAD